MSDVQLIPTLVESLQDLWVRSTNLFGELTMEEIEKNEELMLLSTSIDPAKQVLTIAKS